MAIFFSGDDFAYLRSDNKPKRKSDLEESLRIRKGKYSHLQETLGHWFQMRTAIGSGTACNRDTTPDSGGHLTETREPQ